VEVTKKHETACFIPDAPLFIAHLHRAGPNKFLALEPVAADNGGISRKAFCVYPLRLISSCAGRNR